MYHGTVLVAVSDDGEQEVVAVGPGSGQRRGRPDDHVHRYTSVVMFLWSLLRVSTASFIYHILRKFFRKNVRDMSRYYVCRLISGIQIDQFSCSSFWEAVS